jgi:fatty acyl-CoA reductase
MKVFNHEPFSFLNTDVNSQSWGQMYDDYMELLEEYPFDFSLWRPKAIVTNSYYLHKILTLLFQFIPAFFLDILLKLFGKKSL